MSGQSATINKCKNVSFCKDLGKNWCTSFSLLIALIRMKLIVLNLFNSIGYFPDKGPGAVYGYLRIDII